MIHALYLHIPFCHKICPFCSFAVRPDHHEKHAPYFELVKKEFELLKQEFDLDFSKVRSIYFGGGTPSRLSLVDLEEWVVWLAEVTGAGIQAQWSIEVNPEDMSSSYANGLVEMGFNRISLGIQSFSEECLKKLQRHHTPEDCRHAIHNILEADISDFNLDLMFGYPDQSLGQLQADLAELVRLKPTHISAYCLNIEEKTPLAKRPEWQKWQDTNEQEIATMFSCIVDFLADHGYRQYEISNFAKKGYQSRQNLINWNGKNYLGLGMGAHSLLDQQRWGNYKRWVDYKRALLAGRAPHQFLESLNVSQKRDEILMLSLRQKKGLNLSGFESAFTLDLKFLWHHRLEELRKADLVIIEHGRIRLTTAGMMLADAITADLSALLES